MWDGIRIALASTLDEARLPSSRSLAATKAGPWLHRPLMLTAGANLVTASPPCQVFAADTSWPPVRTRDEPGH